MQHRTLGPFSVSSIGLGCMNLSHAYGAPIAPEQGERVLLSALDAGVTLFDTAALYGFGANETLVGRVLKTHRQKFTLASKCGMQGVDVNGDGKLVRVIDGRPATLKKSCEDSLRRLQTDVIDLYYLHRWDQQVPIEDSVSALGELVRQGHIRSIGLSEVSAATLDACKALGIAFVAFSPLGRGFLGGTLQDVSAPHPTDIRRAMPRFAPDPYAANLQLLPAYLQVAKDAGCTSAQLAIAWLLQRGEHIIPIPGTTSVPHLSEDLAAVNVPLNAAKLDTLINKATVVGARYNAQSHGEVDTGNF